MGRQHCRHSAEAPSTEALQSERLLPSFHRAMILPSGPPSLTGWGCCGAPPPASEATGSESPLGKYRVTPVVPLSSAALLSALLSVAVLARGRDSCAAGDALGGVSRSSESVGVGADGVHPTAASDSGTKHAERHMRLLLVEDSSASRRPMQMMRRE
jgi:hypothetical protein